MPTRMVPIAGCEIANRVAASVRLRGKPLLDQRQQAAGARDIGVIAHGRTDRLGRWTRNGMTLSRSGQRAAGEHADADDADAGRPGMIKQPSIVLCRIIRRQLGGADGLSIL